MNLNKLIVLRTTLQLIALMDNALLSYNSKAHQPLSRSQYLRNLIEAGCEKELQKK